MVALDAVLQEVIALAVGEAVLPVNLPTTVFAVSVARPERGNAVPFDRLIDAGVCIASPVGRVVETDGTPPEEVTTTPLLAVDRLPRTPALS